MVTYALPGSKTALLVILGASLLLAHVARAQVGFRGWVGLYAPADLGWLENENRLRDLCGDPSTLADCHLEKLGPAVSIFPLYGEPDESSPRVGDLIVTAIPGRGLFSHFVPAGSEQTIRFTPDLFLQDWGYGPYFHQTVSAQRGRWFQLPPGPWEQDVWLHREGEQEGAATIVIQTGNIIEMSGSGWYVVATEPDALLLRAEQPGDLWCEGGEPPPITAAEPTRFSRAQLLDSRGHLMLRPKYLKGC